MTDAGGDALWLPITDARPPWRKPGDVFGRLAGTVWAGVRNRLEPALWPRVRRCAHPDDYVAALGRLRLHATGRFHAAALAIRCGVPFLSVNSNSHKIEALVEDFGLDPARVQPLSDIAAAAAGMPWSSVERERINDGLRRAAAACARDFDAVAMIAMDGAVKRSARSRQTTSDAPSL
jgi:hypothetical protein